MQILDDIDGPVRQRGKKTKKVPRSALRCRGIDDYFTGQAVQKPLPRKRTGEKK